VHSGGTGTFIKRESHVVDCPPEDHACDEEQIVTDENVREEHGIPVRHTTRQGLSTTEIMEVIELQLIP
jgi:hypothetical protein